MLSLPTGVVTSLTGQPRWIRVAAAGRAAVTASTRQVRSLHPALIREPGAAAGARAVQQADLRTCADSGKRGLGQGAAG